MEADVICVILDIGPRAVFAWKNYVLQEYYLSRFYQCLWKRSTKTKQINKATQNVHQPKRKTANFGF